MARALLRAASTLLSTLFPGTELAVTNNPPGGCQLPCDLLCSHSRWPCWPRNPRSAGNANSGKARLPIAPAFSGFVTRYLDAMLAHNPKQLAARARDRAIHLKNAVEILKLGDGLWKNASKIKRLSAGYFRSSSGNRRLAGGGRRRRHARAACVAPEGRGKEDHRSRNRR